MGQMKTLLYATASPYSCKVRMAALYSGFKLELVPVQTADRPSALVEANPLAKIPVLLLKSGEAVYDSRAIMRYIDRATGGLLYPREPDRLTSCEVRESLAEGICDAMLLHVYERRYRPDEKVHQPWLDKQWLKVTEAFERLKVDLESLPDRIDASHLGVRAAIGYFDLRFGQRWSEIPHAIRDWAIAFDEKSPDLRACLPRL